MGVLDKAVEEAVVLAAKEASVYEPRAVLPLLDWSVVQFTRWGPTAVGLDQIERGIRRLSVDRPDLFRSLPPLAPREAREHLMRLVDEGRTAEATRFGAKHADAIEAAKAQVVREGKARLAESQRREREAHAQSEALAKAKRKAADLVAHLEVVERTGEHPWNGMGKPPPPPNLREVADLREKVKEAKLAVAVLSR